MSGLTIFIEQKTKGRNHFFQSQNNQILKGKTIIIIGAGIAGLSAALEASALGADVIILEATSRIGGRVHHENDVNLGANLVHSPVFNPIDEIVTSLGLKQDRNLTINQDVFVNSPSAKNQPVYSIASSENIDKPQYYDVNKMWQLWEDTEIVAENKLADLLEKGQYLPGKDYNVQQLLDEYLKQSPKKYDWQQKEVFQSTFTVTDGVELKDVSIFYVEEGEITRKYLEKTEQGYLHQKFGGQDYQLKNYADIATFFTWQFKQSNNVKIFLDKPVKKISYLNNKQEIVCQDGTVFKSDMIISTLPVKVIEKYSEIFNPPLPAPLQTSAKNIAACKWEKVAFDFDPTKLTPEQQSLFMSFEGSKTYLYHPDHKATTVPLFSMLEKKIISENKHVFIGYITADQADKLAMLRNEQGEENAEKQLTVQFKKMMQDWGDHALNKKIVCPDPIGFTLSNWIGSQYSQMSWSAIGKQGFVTDRQTFHVPLYGQNLFFAGEFAHMTYPGTTHGALLSGQDAVLRLVQHNHKISANQLWGQDRQYNSERVLMTLNEKRNEKNIAGKFVLNNDLLANNFHTNSVHQKAFASKHNVEFKLEKGVYYYSINYSNYPVLEVFSDLERQNKLFTARQIQQQGEYSPSIRLYNYNRASWQNCDWALPVKYDPKSGLKVFARLTFDQLYVQEPQDKYVATCHIEVLPMRALDYVLAK